MTAVIIFAKAPTPGRCKTRLSPALGAEGAADLAVRMLATTLAFAQEAGVDEIILRSEPAPDDPAWQTQQIPDTITCLPQGDGDLGERMQRAAAAALRDHQAVMLVGTDCVELSSTWLREASAALSTHDAIIHPSADGGYTLLGLRKCHASLFTDIPWSTAAVTEITLARLDALGWRYQLRTLSHDIDTPDDLIYLPDHWPLPLIR